MIRMSQKNEKELLQEILKEVHEIRKELEILKRSLKIRDFVEENTRKGSSGIGTTKKKIPKSVNRI